MVFMVCIRVCLLGMRVIWLFNILLMVEIGRFLSRLICFFKVGLNVILLCMVCLVMFEILFFRLSLVVSLLIYFWWIMVEFMLVISRVLCCLDCGWINRFIGCLVISGCKMVFVVFVF